MTMTALLRSSLPLVGSGHKHAAQRPQVSQQQNRRALKAPAGSSGAETEAEAVKPATEGLKQDLTAALADLEALDTQLAQATQQLGAEQTKNETERAALEGLQAQLTALKQGAKTQAGPGEATVRPDWHRTMRTAEQIVTMKALITERDAEVADLQRQLAEYEEPEEAAAAVPALVPAGGVREDETDEEGRKRVAVLNCQLTQQLQTGLENQFMQHYPPLPDSRSRKMVKRAFAEDILRSAKFPGLVLVTTASSVGDVCKAAWSLAKRIKA